MLVPLANNYNSVDDNTNAVECSELGLKVISSSLRNPSLNVSVYKQLMSSCASLYCCLAKAHVKTAVNQALLDYDIAAEVFGETYFS